MAETLGFVFSLSMRGVNLPRPDAQCFAEALVDLAPTARSALDQLVADPFTWNQIAGDDALPLAQAYVRCGGDDALLTMLALGLVGIPDVECVRLAWTARLGVDMVASSLALGNGLDDLPPDLVDQLASRAVECWSDRTWWIDELALDLLDELEITTDLARCVATAYVDRVGIERAVSLQILTLPLLTLATDDQRRLDLANRCGVTLPPNAPDVSVGSCLLEFGMGTLTEADCAGTHNAEVVAVHDLDARHPLWPGMRTVRESTQDLCRADIEAVGGDVAGYGAGWNMPTRASWERGRRSLTCVLVRPNYHEWTGPSGLIPVALPTTASTTASAAVPATTLPPGAHELFDIDQITEIGTCIYRAPASPGQADVDRRFFQVDCSVPHQGEFYYRFDLEAGPDAPYPGDEAVQNQADAACLYVFGPYVGEPWKTSRLDYVYYYPSVGTWAERDRSVLCFLTGSRPEEMLTRAMAGSGE